MIHVLVDRGRRGFAVISAEEILAAEENGSGQGQAEGSASEEKVFAHKASGLGGCHKNSLPPGIFFHPFAG
jgi:hypothetical protein